MRNMLLLAGFFCVSSLFTALTPSARADVTLTQGGAEAFSLLAYTDSLDELPVILDVADLGDGTGARLIEKNKEKLSVVILDPTAASCRRLLDRYGLRERPRTTYIFKKDKGSFWMPAGGKGEDPLAYQILIKASLREIETANGDQAEKPSGRKDRVRGDELIELDGARYALKDFRGAGILSRAINLDPGVHRVRIIENPFINVHWVILEPLKRRPGSSGPGPEITFRRIHPAKYLIKVAGARAPFWLIFSSTFDSRWQLFEMPAGEGPVSAPGELLTSYPVQHIREAAPRSSFEPADVRYLFKRPKDIPHYRVNGYANGWFIDPGQSRMGEEFTLVLYFGTQSLLAAGLMIAGLSFLGTAGVLGAVNLKKRRKNGAS